MSVFSIMTSAQILQLNLVLPRQEVILILLSLFLEASYSNEA